MAFRILALVSLLAGLAHGESHLRHHGRAALSTLAESDLPVCDGPMVDGTFDMFYSIQGIEKCSDEDQKAIYALVEPTVEDVKLKFTKYDGEDVVLCDVKAARNLQSEADEFHRSLGGGGGRCRRCCQNGCDRRLALATEEKVLEDAAALEKDVIALDETLTRAEVVPVEIEESQDFLNELGSLTEYVITNRVWRQFNHCLSVKPVVDVWFDVTEAETTEAVDRLTCS